MSWKLNRTLAYIKDCLLIIDAKYILKFLKYRKLI